ncbi:MAG: class I SAM-dependent DNA methyltransferase [Opitutaceae bacterium]|nr:class I SAM-dependent DNA methyltransferase [Opitutaceae bacterium]
MSVAPPSPAVVTLSREEMKSRALAFAKAWAGPQREEAEAKTFLDQFFAVFGRDRRSVDAHFEHRVEREARGEGRIDLFWPGKLLVEMKSTGRDLSTGKGGAARQAFDYIDALAPDERPRWVLVSDFGRFALYDLGEEVHDYLKGFATARKTPPALAAAFTLADLPDKLRHFAFIRDEEQHLFQAQPDINLRAVALLGDLHDELKKTGYSGHRLERLLVRVLFCLFAEDTDIFEWNSFTRFVERTKKDGSDLGAGLARLFQVLDQPADARSSALPADLAAFPYVNGGLFAEKLDIADMTAEHRAALLACCRFDWSRISPGVFGSLFQGVMDKKERRAKGAHYTSEENIRRVLDPLCLDDLKAEFEKIRASTGKRLAALTPADLAPSATKSRKVAPSPFDAFHDKLASLRFLDPACGCGNFLVVAYRELRALELEVLQAIHGGQLPLGLGVEDIARVNVDQFYGIELEEFPALIAETALWLTDHQVNMAFSKAFGRHFARIPLVKSATIVPGNALRLDWKQILPPEKCSYVLGNPPFIGKQYMNAEQNADMALVCGDIKGHGLLDYVTAWYLKAGDYIRGTAIRCAFVSTNSISQGEQVGLLWSHLFSRYRLKIHFAHRTFVWHNEASGKAHVHVVIIGFGAVDAPLKRLYDYDAEGRQTASSGTLNINPYLIVGTDTVVTARTKPLCPVPEIVFGSMPNDGGHLLLTSPEKEQLLAAEPKAQKFIRPLLGAEEFINDVPRWCLWLVEATATELRAMPAVMKRIEGVRQHRLASTRAATRKLAATPALFGENRQPMGRYLAIPSISSERRRYIPMAFLEPSIIGNNKLLFVPDATAYHFGVLSSAIHIAWVRVVTGRLKSDFQYSNKLVYNNYPWPEPDAKQRAAIEAAAQAVLDARAPRLAAGASLADLYDPLAMPAELLKAHQALDRAVDRAYRAAVFTSDRERVEFLFARYEQLTAPLAPAAKPGGRRNQTAI